MKKKLGIAVGILGVLAVAAVGGYLIWCSSLEDNVIWPDYRINQVSIKGMTMEEARDAVEKRFEEDYGAASITVTIADR